MRFRGFLTRLVGCVAMALVPCSLVLGEVKLSGVRGAVRENVLSHLLLDEVPCDAPGWRVRRLTRQAEPQVRKALEAYGYYSPVISIRSSATASCWLAEIVVEEGKPVVLRRVEVAVTGEAEQDAGFSGLLRRNPLKSGAVLNHPAYEAYKKRFVDLARQKGYFSGAFVVSRIEVSTAESAADITLRFDSGPRYQFGPVTFEQDVVRQDLVERFVTFRRGSPYDGAEISELYDDLLGTGYFGSVDLRTLPGTPPDLEVPVLVQLTGAMRHVYTAGAGYSTDMGPKLRAGYTNRIVNDKGHQFDAFGSVSKVESEVGLSYRLPRDDPRVEWLSFDTGYKYVDTDTRISHAYKVGVKEYHRRPRGWIETWFMDVGVERFEIAGDTQREFLLVPGISWSNTFPDDSRITRPDKGHRVAVKLSGTTEYLGSDSEFFQTDLYGKLILPLWRSARVLMRAETGVTIKDEFRTLPASVRYFAGGDYSVRGYDYESLGPTDEFGNVVGGSHKLVGSIELDQRILGNWSVAAFADSGNAFDSFSSVRTKTGVGGGLRWYSPLGPVRVDVAFPLDKDAEDDWRIHITLGPDL